MSDDKQKEQRANGASEAAETVGVEVRGLLSAGLGVLTLSCLVFGQPVLDVIRRNPEFLSIRGHALADMLVVMASLLLVLPLPAMALLVLVWRRWPAKFYGVAGALAGALIALILLQLLRGSGAAALWPLGIVLAGLVGWLFARSAPMRSYILFLSPALLLIPLTFLVNGEVRRSLAGASPKVETFDSGAEAPIIFVVFDEWSLASILNEHGELDRERLPNIARLAGHSTWYRRAMAVSDVTEISVPAMLSGTFPSRDTLPILADHPVNLFTLFSDYAIYADEPITRLCPPELNRLGSQNAGLRQRLSSLVRDLPIVWLHETVPASLAGSLPSLAGRWSGFGDGGARARLGDTEERAAGDGEGRDRPTSKELFKIAVDRLGSGERDLEFEAFLDRIGKTPQKSLHFIHSLLPHAPWEYTPSGGNYITSRGGIAGLSGEVWYDQEAMESGLQRFLLQVGFVDHLIGRLLDRLEEFDLFEESLIVIGADHGVSFQKDVSRRVLEPHTDSPRNAAALASIPLFVKQPAQVEGLVSDEQIALTDVLPRLYEALKARPPEAFSPSSRPSGSFLSKHSPLMTLDLSDRGVHLPELAQRVSTFRDSSDPWQLKLGEGFVGQPLSALNVARSLNSIDLFGAGQYRSFNPDHGVVPTLVEGSIELVDGDGGVPVGVLIAVNGVVEAAGVVFEPKDQTAKFAAMVPEAAFEEGPNEVAVVLMRSSGEGVFLETSQQLHGAYTLLRDEAGEPHGLRLGAQEFRIVSEGDKLEGFLYNLKTAGNLVRFQGWAVDKRPGTQLHAVALFLEDELLSQGQTFFEGPEGLKGPEDLEAGFSFQVPRRQLVDLEATGVSAYAIAEDGIARLLHAPFLALQEEDGQTILARTSGKRYRVVEGAIDGYLDGWKLGEDFIWRVDGWAAEVDAERPAEMVAVYRDGEPVRQDPLVHPRPDVANTLKRPELANSGFKLQLPHAWVEEIRAGKIKIYGLSHGDLASELGTVSLPEMQ